MRCPAILHHILRHDAHLVHRLTRHIARHKLAHVAAAVGLACAGGAGVVVHEIQPAPVRYEGPVHAVPEPGGVWVFAVGLGGVVLVRRAS
jgi:hypothetical protein